MDEAARMGKHFGGSAVEAGWNEAPGRLVAIYAGGKLVKEIGEDSTMNAADPNEEAAQLLYEANLPEVTPYRYYNPHAHLLHCSFLSPTEWERVKTRLTPADLANIENGGVVQVGAAAKVWKPEAIKKVA